MSLVINSLIVDDEPLARQRLRDLLAEWQTVQIVGEADSGRDAIHQIETHNPDLVFLDIQMPDIDGFGVLRMLQVDKLPLVVFVTAYDEYAIKAFEVNAVDYLLKPIHHDRLEKAIAKAHENLAFRQTTDVELQTLLKNTVYPLTKYLQRLPVRSQNRILILTLEEVTSLRLNDGLVYATTVNGEYWTKYTIFTELEELLDPQIFRRFHRQTIVNLNHVREVSSYDKNSARLTLSCGRQVVVSRSHIKEFRKAFSL